MMNCLNKMEILKCTHKRIKDRLRTYYEKIWKDMLVKTNKSLVYREHKSEFKMESYLTQVTNISHRRALTKLRLSDHKLEIENVEDTLGPRSIEKVEHVSFVVNQTNRHQLRTKSTSSPDVIILCK